MKPKEKYLFLTEETLGDILKEKGLEYEFIHNKAITGSGTQSRPDYRSEKLMTIIEFDGDTHYCSAKRILSDQEKDRIYESLGYQIIHIPYFIQMTKKILYEIFKKEVLFNQVYQHGFISEKAILPADYCELGIQRFLTDLDKYSDYKDDILSSLKIKIEKKQNIDLVLPKSLQFLILNNQSI